MKRNSKYKLAIFDFDDTLVHLDIDWEKVKIELIEKVEADGTKIPERIKSADPMDAANYLSERGYKELVVSDFRKNEDDCVRRGGCTIFPSMMRLLKELKAAGYLIAIASGNTTITINEVLSKEGISPDFIAGQDSIRVNKPYPDILNLILRQLKVGKEEAIFIGNSSFDARAGKNAGIKTIIIKPNNEKDVALLSKLLLH
ncbi:MAG: HAD family hydrolase [Candidatus Bilamarchaeaceae archaeon]